MASAPMRAVPAASTRRETPPVAPRHSAATGCEATARRTAHALLCASIQRTRCVGPGVHRGRKYPSLAACADMDANDRTLREWLLCDRGNVRRYLAHDAGSGVCSSHRHMLAPLPWLEENLAEVTAAWNRGCVRCVVDAALVAALQRPGERDLALRLLWRLPAGRHSVQLMLLLLGVADIGPVSHVVLAVVAEMPASSLRNALHDALPFERLWEHCRRRPRRSAVQALYRLLPAFVAKHPERVRTLCDTWYEITDCVGVDEYISQFNEIDVHWHLYGLLANRYPDLFVVRKSDASSARTSALCALYRNRRDATSLGTNPHVTASSLYARSDRKVTHTGMKAIGMLQRCADRPDCQCWALAVVDHLECLQPHKDLMLWDLVLALREAGQFDALVRLVAAGLGVCCIAYCHAPIAAAVEHGGAPNYTAADIARALQLPVRHDAVQWQRCAPSRDLPTLSPAAAAAAAAKQYIEHVYWLSTAHWRPYERPPPGLPAWTPEAHQALYRHNQYLHDTTQALFMLHELRAASSLASLPYELLFAVLECVRASYCMPLS